MSCTCLLLLRPNFSYIFVNSVIITFVQQNLAKQIAVLTDAVNDKQCTIKTTKCQQHIVTHPGTWQSSSPEWFCHCLSHHESTPLGSAGWHREFHHDCLLLVAGFFHWPSATTVLASQVTELTLCTTYYKRTAWCERHVMNMMHLGKSWLNISPVTCVTLINRKLTKTWNSGQMTQYDLVSTDCRLPSVNTKYI